jgi:hypothetical protein
MLQAVAAGRGGLGIHCACVLVCACYARIYWCEAKPLPTVATACWPRVWLARERSWRDYRADRLLHSPGVSKTKQYASCGRIHSLIVAPSHLGSGEESEIQLKRLRGYAARVLT